MLSLVILLLYFCDKEKNRKHYDKNVRRYINVRRNRVVNVRPQKYHNDNTIITQ